MRLTTNQMRNQLVNHCWLSDKVNVQAGIYRRIKIVSKNCQKEN